MDASEISVFQILPFLLNKHNQISEHEKGTMTGGDNVQGSSSSHPDLGNNCSVRIRDRTEEMRKLMDENAKNRPVRIVDNVHGVPITEFTHIVPISDQERDDGPSTSGSYPNREPAQVGIENNFLNQVSERA